MISLKEELYKENPFDAVEQEAYLNVMRTHENLFEEFSELFKRHGVTQSQYNVLRILRGHNGTGIRTLEIIKYMVNRVPDITRLIDRMEKSGLVKRCHFPKDRRVVLVQITGKGSELLEQLDEPVLALHQRQLSHMTKSEQTELNRLLFKARHPSN